MTHARDSRIDFFRGLALICILVDHIPGNLLAGVTLQNLAFADAAEVLVLLAGISAAAGAASRAANANASTNLTSWSLQRAAKLYVAHIVVVAVTLTAFAIASRLLHSDALANFVQIDRIEHTGWKASFQLLTLQLQPDYLNILPLYVGLVCALPLIEWLIRTRPIAALGLSALVWLLAASTAFNLPSTVHPTGWYFNPFAWQFLFTIGLASWTYRDRIDRWMAAPQVRRIATAVVVLAFIAKAPWAQIPAFAHLQFDTTWLVDQSSKTNLALPRLLNVLALAILACALVGRTSPWLEMRTGIWVRLIGQYALPVYVAASLFDALATIARLSGARSVSYQLLANAIGLLLVTAVAWTARAAEQTGPGRRQSRPTGFEAVSAASWRVPTLVLLLVASVWTLNVSAQANEPPSHQIQSTAGSPRTLQPEMNADGARSVALGTLIGIVVGASLATAARWRRRDDPAKPSAGAETEALDIIAIASHEMRTHLAAIASASQQMLEQSNSRTENARTIARSAETLIEIATNTLDLARLDNEPPRLEYAAFDLRQMLAEVVVMLQEPAGAKRLTLRLDYASDLPARVVGSAGPLRQIVVNLAANAIKFTDSGRVTIRVSGLASTDTAHVRIAVEDTGRGIPRDQQARIFDAFVQLDPNAQAGRAGLGLGLAISQRLARLMGSVITVDSRPGLGSAFALSLDLPIDGSAAQADATEPQPPVDEPMPRRILIADDVDTNRRLVAAMLAASGTEIALAATGEEAVAKALSFDPDVILMDVSMPDMDGLEATRRIRQAEVTARRPATPIIAFTAHGMRGDRSKCLTSGMDDYLTKPVRKAALRNVVGKWSRVKNGAPRPDTSYPGPERRLATAAAS